MEEIRMHEIATSELRDSRGRSVRIFVLAVAALLLLAAFSSFIGQVRASAGFFDPPHSDYAIDTDMPPNGLYNELIVNVTVNVTLAGMFVVVGELYDNSGMNFITQVWIQPNLALGNQTVPLAFPGYMIRSSGFDGPYQCDLYLLDDLLALLDIDTHMTGVYNATEFETAPASFSPPHTDYGRDDDGDTFYDYLVVSLNLTVNVSGDYEIDTILWDSANMTNIEFKWNYTFLNTGQQTVDIEFTGYIIRTFGIDGPYWVELYLYDSMFNTLDIGGHLTNPYLFTDFQYAPALFFPPHSDMGIDTDGNTFFEFLLVTVNVNVTVDGWYRIQGMGPEVGWAENYTFLNAGIQAVDLLFYGYQIYNSLTDGPYAINLWLYDDTFNLIDTDSHLSGLYRYTEFEPNPPIFYVPPYADDGIDADGDTKFDYLRVQTRYYANASGVYYFYADLWDITRTIYITGITNSTFFPAGPGQVDFLLSGYDIWASGIDGPYWVDIYIADEFWTVLDNDTHITGPYLYTDFDAPSGMFSPPHSDYGLDTSMPADGIYEKLVVNASVFVNTPGWFMVNAWLLDPMWMNIAMDQVYVNLTAGFNNVTLQYSGIDVYNSGMNGTFVVAMDLYEAPMMGPPIWLDSDFHFTGWYNYTDFAYSPPALIWGYVYEAASGLPLDSAEVAAVNYTFGSLFQTMTDAAGYYEINAYDGDFYMLFDHGNFQADGYHITVSTSTEASQWLDPIPRDAMISRATFPDWDNFLMDGAMNMAEDNKTMRLMIDTMIGNMDGYVDQAESDLFASLFGGGSPPPIPGDTNGILHVDTIWYDFVPGTMIWGIDLTGPVDSTNAIAATFHANYTSNSTIPPAATHLMQIWTDYDNPTETFFIYGVVPAPFNLQSYDPVPNVTVTGVGTPNFDVDPLDGIGGVWVNLTFSTAPPDNQAPEIQNPTINGLGSVTYGLSNLPPVIYLNATINDVPTGNSIILGSNYTAGWQNWGTSTPMNPVDGAFDSPTEDVTAIITSPPMGQTLYCVYGWDIVPNHNTMGVCPSLEILDDLGPQVLNVMIDGAPTQNYMLSTAPMTATLTATIDEATTGSANVVGANYTTPMPDSWPGILMIPTDGAFDSPTEDAEATITVPTSAGTFDYFVHGWDSLSNAAYGGPGQITIVDDVDPVVVSVLLDGQPGTSVMPGTPVTVDAVIDDTINRGDTAIAGANFTIGAAVWPGQWMLPADGAFDTATESATETIDTTGWMDGVYDVCVYGWDSVPNYNNTGLCVQLTISSVDDQAPLILNVQVNGQPSVTVSAGTSVALTATIDDATTLGSDIGGANYTIGAGNWASSTTMSAQDGTFDSPTEDVTAAVDTTSWAPGTYNVCVYGWDVEPNYNVNGACAQITIIDTTPPTISNIAADPDPAAPGTDVRVSAEVNDDVQVQDVWIEYRDPDGTAVGNFTMSYDSVDAEYYHADSYSDEGAYTFTIWAVDTSGNWASATGDFEIVEQTPPTIDVTVTPDEPEVGETVYFEAEVDDDNEIDDVRITITDSDDNTVVNNRRMTEDGGVYAYDYEFDEAGDYTYTITAADEHGNSDDATGTISVSKAAAGPSFFEDFWWLILLIVIIIIVVLLLAGIMMRKPKVQEFEPIPEMEMAPEEEPPMEEIREEPMEEPYEEIPEEPREPPIEDEVPEEPPPPEDYIEGGEPPEPPKE